MASDASALAGTASRLANQTLVYSSIPALPDYDPQLVSDMFPWISDLSVSLLLPVVVYWIMSLSFHAVDVWDLFPQYRLHTPQEIVSRNHATRYEVARDVVIQQLIQVSTGFAMAMLEPAQTVPNPDYAIAYWASRLRIAQRALPALLGLFGLNAMNLSKSMSASYPSLSGALAGGYYPSLAAAAGKGSMAAFVPWETSVAKLIYYLLIPGLQLFLAVFILDSWQYFLHRLMHTSRWLYSHFHSRHHRLYVPYAYGALYNHPLEGFLLDTFGASLAYKLTGLTMRQGTVFFTLSTIKTIDDHCGYSFPWDPLQMMTSNNAAYHDIHHQTWGIKTNFAQPFFTFWDSLLGTKYNGPRKNRLADKAAQAKKAK